MERTTSCIFLVWGLHREAGVFSGVQQHWPKERPQARPGSTRVCLGVGGSPGLCRSGLLCNELVESWPHLQMEHRHCVMDGFSRS